MIKTILSIIVSFILLCLLVPGLIFSFSPSVETPPPFTPQDISKLKKTLAKSNPFEFQRYKHQALVFDQQLLNQSANFALSKLSNAYVDIKLQNNLAKAEASIQIPNIPINLFINLACDISPTENVLQISNISLGSLGVPDWLLNQISPVAMKYAIEHHPEYINLLETVNKVDIQKNKLTVYYHWNTQLSKKIKTAGRNFLLDPEQQELLRIYYQNLGELSRLYFWRPIGLHKVIQPIFKLAKNRTEAGSDPIKENKAAILALGIMASGIRANHLLQDENSKPFRNAYFFRLSLLKRRDLMQHFLISSALTVSTNKLLSDTIGLSKEIDDSEGGSGFSFADLLADRAGVKLAQMAIQDEASARKMQNLLSQSHLKEIDFMPPHDHLPESITALEFKRKYIDIHHEKYLFVEEELEQRIASRPIYLND